MLLDYRIVAQRIVGMAARKHAAGPRRAILMQNNQALRLGGVLSG
jgi:hypothetical protein